MHIRSRCKRSVNTNLFDRLTFCTISPGPCSTFTPLLPNRPVGGRTKAAVSNQCASERWSVGKLPLPIRSGSPPDVFVPDGSAPEKLGEKYWPVCRMLTHASFHPPSTSSTARGALPRKRLPLPNGSSH